jgi:hypothetical protein
MSQQPKPSPDIDAAEIDAAIIAAARKLGALYPQDVPRLIDRSDIAVADSGRVLGVDQVVEEFARRHPKLFRLPAPDDRPTKDVPKSLLDRARAVIDKHAFFFDPSIPLGEIAEAMIDLGGMTEARASSILVSRMTTPCHWNRFSIDGRPSNPDWQGDPRVREALVGKPAAQCIAESKERLAQHGISSRYW